tara:strand:+ start:71 stop:1024 length:954 start_codon:yes stop_codon:yes gene_type:complete
MSLSIEGLYEAYMEETTPFGEDVWEFFGGERTGFTAEEWAADWGMYLPTYDPTSVHLAERERDIDYEKALNLLDVSSKAADRVYSTETDIISSNLGTEIGKAREVAGGIGLRSGSLESAVQDSVTSSSNKVKDLGDRLMIQKQADKDKYNAAMVDAALDFDKAEHQEKKELYDRTLAQISKLGELGAFAEKTCEDDSLNECPEGTTLAGTCVSDISTDCGTVDIGGSQLEFHCNTVCLGVGVGCFEACTATGMGFDPAIDFSFEEEELIQDECYNDLGEWICGDETASGCLSDGDCGYNCSCQNGACMQSYSPYGPC